MDRDTADDRLQYDASDVEPCVHLELCAATRHAHGNDGGDSRCGYDESKQAVTKLDGLVESRRSAFHRDKGAWLAFRPGGTTQSRAGHADNGTRHGDATLAQEEDERDEALLLQCRGGFLKEALDLRPVIHA